MRAWLVFGALCLVACASGKGGVHDIDANTSGMEDAGVPTPDGPPKHGFGEPCMDNQQCESGLCIVVGTSGQCTQTCGDCPAGYGCLGVTGIQVEGQITFVCVPTSSQLCTSCAQDSECTLIGMDKCVTYPDGDKACAQDCSQVSCPVGYACNTVNIGGTNFKQCMADSGACDCTAANPGAMQPCNIMTPWNVCIGAQACGGASGWGACQPPSMNDDPDATYTDSNCDGIDGDRARAIFVSPAGVNSSTCGLVYTDPCQTIQFGISRAVAVGRPHVYVQSGTYTGSVTMANGISVFGGYNFNWQRDSYAVAGHAVTINGGTVAVRFNNITMPTWLDDVIVHSASATSAGGSSMGVLVTNSSLVEVRGVLVDPGAGANGIDGSNGTLGADGGNGGDGGPGVEHSGALFCNNHALPVGGYAGASSCSRPGGVGGAPGVGGGAGSTGGDGVINPASGGFGGVSRMAGSPGATGSNGADGADGGGGGSIGAFSGSTYVTANGGLGGDGGHGNGGGGGGGGGGGTTDCDSSGSSGGGGGGGGCGGTHGTGGTGGGGSFGVVALDSDVTLTTCDLKGGSGGAGGRGGSGGGFGSGGLPGNGGPYGGSSEQDDGGMGAGGGGGGHGGRGGDGGGGGGGPSVALVCLGTSANNTTILSTSLTPGTGGNGGASLSPGAAGMSAMSYGCQ